MIWIKFSDRPPDKIPDKDICFKFPDERKGYILMVFHWEPSHNDWITDEGQHENLENGYWLEDDNYEYLKFHYEV